MANDGQSEDVRNLSRFARALKARIGELGLTQAELATRAGIDRAEMSRLATGKRAPRPQEVLGLCRALKTTPRELGLGEQYTIDDPKAAEQVKQATERMLGLESEAAELRARLEQLEHQLDGERKQAFDREQALGKQLEQAQRQHVEQLATREREHDEDLRRARDATRQAQDESTRRRAEASQLRAALDARQVRIHQLERQLAGEESRRATSMVATGLATFFITAAIADKR